MHLPVAPPTDRPTDIGDQQTDQSDGFVATKECEKSFYWSAKLFLSLPLSSRSVGGRYLGEMRAKMVAGPPFAAPFCSRRRRHHLKVNQHRRSRPNDNKSPLGPEDLLAGKISIYNNNNNNHHQRYASAERRYRWELGAGVVHYGRLDNKAAESGNTLNDGASNDASFSPFWSIPLLAPPPPPSPPLWGPFCGFAA